LGNEIESAAVHCRADVVHVAVSRNDDRSQRYLAFLQFGQERESVHRRHVDIEEQKLDFGVFRQYGESLLPMASETKGKIARTDLPAEALLQQRLEVGLVIDGEYLRLSHLPSRKLSDADCDRGNLTANSVKTPTSLSTVTVPPCC